MASPSSLPSEWQFQCSVCLEVFTDPVSIPCGHSFCKVCLSGYWDSSGVRQCPLCKRTFKDSLGLGVNVVLAEITQDFKRRRVDAPEPRSELPGEATVGPATDGVCEKHALPLELFCSTDRVCVCARCAETDHGTHSTVPIEREWTLRCSQLKTEVLEVKQSILDRQRKVEEVKQRVELSRRDAEKELEEGLQVLAAVLRSVEKCQVELRGVIEGKQRTAEKRAEGLVGELEQEIGELKRRNAELKQLLRTQDRAHVLQSFPSQHTPLCSRHWPDVIIHTDLCVGTVRSVLSPLEEDFREKVRELTDAEFKNVQQYADDVTLDPITAHVNLTVSEDGKEVRYHNRKQNLPDNPERFDLTCNVLGKEMFTSGRHYCEVQVEGKTAWYLGVALESIRRKGSITMTSQYGPWLLHLKEGDLKALDDSPVKLSLSSMPKKVGVYVDYEEGQISLYNVEARSLIFSFMGNVFTDKLRLLLNPQAADTVPMIISPVVKAD